jgi:hypothetical protein
MPLYRLYTLGDDGHISRPATILDCEQDQEAVEAAKRQVDGHAVELWEGPRQIAKLAPERAAKPPSGQMAQPKEPPH